MSPSHTAPPGASFLVIRRDNIGDLVCTTPLIHALRRHYPRGRVCVLVNSYSRPVVENNPDIDVVYHYTKAKHLSEGESVLGAYWRRIRLMQALRRARFDYAIIAGAHFLPRALRLARAVHPRHIVGFTEPGHRGARHIDVGVPYTLPHPMHEVEDVFRLLQPLGIGGPPPAMRVYAEATALSAAEDTLAAHGLARRNVIGVHISARKLSNRWPADRFVALIRALHREYDASFMLFWSPGSALNPRHPGDDEKAQTILAALPGLPVLPWATERLDQLIAGLTRCHQVVCSDGGAMHVAAALGKPIVCFFGQSDATRWYPWGVPHVILQPPSRNAGDVTVADAVAGFERLRGLLAHPHANSVLASETQPDRLPR
jgi:ADP-heptose:LPS heptosyltransferase